MPDGTVKADSSSKPSGTDLDWQLVEASLRIQEQYGGEYMDDNPIAGRPGEFHFSSTGRKSQPIRTGSHGCIVAQGCSLACLEHQGCRGEPTGSERKGDKEPEDAGYAQAKAAQKQECCDAFVVRAGTMIGFLTRFTLRCFGEATAGVMATCIMIPMLLDLGGRLYTFRTS